MPVTIKSTGGGSVTVQAPNTASDYTVDFPAANGTMIVASGGVVPASQGGTGLSSPGTSGNVLTSNGTAWTSAAAPVINVQTFTSSGTWTKPAGYSASSRVLIQAWGGGGSGARSALGAGGGGGGGYNERWVTLSTMGATETITIGAGGNTAYSTGTLTTSPGYIIHTFTGDGTFTTNANFGGTSVYNIN